MKVHVTWEARSLKYQDATVKYRLPSLPIFLELRSKYGQAISDDQFTGTTNILIEFLVWMILEWENFETDQDPPVKLDCTKEHVRRLLEYDADFRMAMLNGTELIKHLGELQVGHREKYEDERKNLKVVATYWWTVAATDAGIELHAVEIDGVLYMKDAIKTHPNNHETFAILSWMDSLKMDFARAVELYQQLLSDVYSAEKIYDLQEKVNYVKSIWSELAGQRMKQHKATARG